ncbi:hypothetical protein ALMP_59400 [Streptomyces sp. A012304]|nr:hypothetical protein ALMP_59400 [Streptomyces sp. A012304]
MAIDNKVRALILQNQWDSQTPLAGAQGLHRVLKGSKMVTVAGGVGHGVYGFKSCADKTATTYLTTGEAGEGRDLPDRSSHTLAGRQPESDGVESGGRAGHRISAPGSKPALKPVPLTSSELASSAVLHQARCRRAPPRAVGPFDALRVPKLLRVFGL